MNKNPLITGTFIDEITYDIPSSNWTLEQWRKDLDYMQEIGIDTVIFIRGGFEDKSVFPSKVLGTSYADDLAGFIFEETSQRNMDVFFLECTFPIWIGITAMPQAKSAKTSPLSVRCWIATDTSLLSRGGISHRRCAVSI